MLQHAYLSCFVHTSYEYIPFLSIVETFVRCLLCVSTRDWWSGMTATPSRLHVAVSPTHKRFGNQWHRDNDVNNKTDIYYVTNFHLLDRMSNFHWFSLFQRIFCSFVGHVLQCLTISRLRVWSSWSPHLVINHSNLRLSLTRWKNSNKNESSWQQQVVKI